MSVVIYLQIIKIGVQVKCNIFSDANLSFRLHVHVSLVGTAHKTAKGHSQAFPLPYSRSLKKKKTHKCGEAQLKSYKMHIHILSTFYYRIRLLMSTAETNSQSDLLHWFKTLLCLGPGWFLWESKWKMQKHTGKKQQWKAARFRGYHWCCVLKELYCVLG